MGNNYEIVMQKINNCINHQNKFLEKHELSQIDDEIHLTSLSLSGMLLTELTDDLVDAMLAIPKLTGLNLAHNNLSRLPSNFRKLVDIDFLLLHDNQFTTFPFEVFSLDKLVLLELSRNKLSELPSEIGMLSELEFLQLDDNQLKQLPPKIGNLKKLLHLEVARNELTVLPDEITNLSKIYLLDLTKNPLKRPTTKIQDWLKTIHSLKMKKFYYLW